MSDIDDPYREWDAAYVVGALSPEQRRTFERHLAGCDECKAGVASLAGMPGILGMLTADEAVALTELPDDSHLRGANHDPLAPPQVNAAPLTVAHPTAANPAAANPAAPHPAASNAPEPLTFPEQLAATAGGPTRFDRAGDPADAAGTGDAGDTVRRLAVRISRRRRRVRATIAGLLVAAAAVFAVSGLTVGATLGHTAATVGALGPEHTMTSASPAVMSATLRLSPRDWGTRIDWSCSYPTSTWTGGSGSPAYDLVVTDAHGHHTTVAKWTAAGTSAQGLVASTDLRRNDIRRVEIRLEGSSTPLAWENV